MNTPALQIAEFELLRSVFRRHAAIRAVKLFGSWAKGTHKPDSDIDLAIWGDVSPLHAEQIAAELDELPLPYRYDVRPFDAIKLLPLRDHIERAGTPIYLADETPSAGWSEDSNGELDEQFARAAKL